jgi:hypothetical protein
MPAIERVWTGAQGLVYYGETLLYVDQWSVEIVQDIIDISNINQYTLPVTLDAFDLQNPDFPVWEKFNQPVDLQKKQANYGTAREFIGGGMRNANITCSGLCATNGPLLLDHYMPRINNLVYIQFSNSTTPNKTLFNFPTCIVKNVTFEFNVKNYQRWTMQAVTTGEFDIYPGEDI